MLLSLPAEDVEFLDAYAESQGIKSRSAVVHKAVRLLRASELPVRGRPHLVLWRHRRHNGAMPSVQIKDVPEDVHAVLRRRAAEAHQSLQEYLRSRLIDEASRPTLREVFDRAGGRAGGSVTLKAAARAVRGDRARR